MEQAYAITHSQAIGVQGNPELSTLYDAYGSKLMGYILALVKNRENAEECLVKIFTEIYRRKQNGTDTNPANTWCWLMELARQQITTLEEGSQQRLNKDFAIRLPYDSFLNKMSAEQQLVFCGAYYHHKTVAELAAELNITEPTVRLKIKEAFTIIRGV